MSLTAQDEKLFDRWRRRMEALIREHPLQLVSWEATRRCNLRCLHCGSPAEKVDLDAELTADEVVGAFEQIAAGFDMTQFRHVNVTGGEPFVRPDLLDILRRISRIPHFRNTDIQTNGIVLADHPELLDELSRVGVTGLGISIDGLEDTHDAFRRIPGGFAKSFKAARLSVEHGYVTTVSVVAHAKNIDEIPDLFDLSRREIHPRVFRVMTIDPIGRMDFDSEYMLSPDQVRQVLDFLRTEYAASCATYADPATTMVELGCGGWLGRDLEGLCRPFIWHCIAGINNLGILYDGKLASCSNVSRDFIEGDLRTERIKEVWDNRYERYRDREWMKTGPCATCDEWAYCHGGPMHQRRSNSDHLECPYLGVRSNACLPPDACA
ncbi:MAG: radical SAM protein [Phycisphaerae bacterium]|nr:radical SAM protein [Phycisphaerae bacterium]